MWQNLKNIYHWLQALVAHTYYGFPAKKLKVVGVTGTSGKTTTTLMIYEVLKSAGLKVSVLCTLKAVIGGKEYDTGFHVTTPDPHVLPKFLKEAVDHGDEYFILEVSSHGLDQNRVALVPFIIGVLTSLAHEHLDYHKTMENYAKAKFKLLHSADKVILPFGTPDDNLKNAVQFAALKNKIATFGLNSGDFTQEAWKLRLHLRGDYNITNALAAAAACFQLNIDKKQIKTTLENFYGIPGRFEEIANKRGVKIIIDFAHKPDALEAVLRLASGIVKQDQRIICMFGCASERDTLKRPMMGEISAKFADFTVLTDEDPRREDPMKIINEIAEGCENAGAIEKNVILSDSEESKKRKDPFLSKADQDDNKHVYFKIPDRLQAIDFIINQVAKKGDLILLCGKGHEQSMNYHGIEKPWSEHEAVKQALRKQHHGF